MQFPSWIRWYKKPEYRDIKQYATEVQTGARPMTPPDKRNKGCIPPHLTLQRILENKTCSPMSLYDFYMYLKHIELSPENLEFYIWFKDYESRWASYNGAFDDSNAEEEDTGLPSPTWKKKNASQQDVKESEGEKDPEYASETASHILQTILPAGATCPQFACSQPKPTTKDRVKAVVTACSVPIRSLRTTESDQSLFSSKNYSSSPSSPGYGYDTGTGVFDPRLELQAIIETYLLPSSPKELNIPPSLRDAALAGLSTSSHNPSHLLPVAEHALALLRTCSHPNFLRLGVANGTLETVCVATSLGIVLTLAGILLVLLRALVPFVGAHSRLDLLGAWFMWFIGLGLILSGLRGSCFFLLLFSRRQPLPWERFDDSASVASSKLSGGAGPLRALKRLMIFDRKLRVKDLHLRRLQRKIVVQSLVGGAVFATVGVLGFVFLPVWKETR